MSSMESEDEVLVVIVGDNSSTVLPMTIKEEVIDEEGIYVEDLIETAERHGEVIHLEGLKTEPVEEEVEYIFDDEFVDEFADDDNVSVKQEGFGDYDYIPQEYGDDDDYIPQDEDSNSEAESGDENSVKIKQNRSTRKETHRYSMLRPHQRKSFVQELRDSDPELKRDQKALIETLSIIMRNSKPPPLPKHVFFMNKEALFQCRVCHAQKESEPAVSRHWQERHGPRYLNCYSCGVDFRSRTNLYKHEKRCEAADALIVLKARALFLGRKGRGRPFLPTQEVLEIHDKQRQACAPPLQCARCPAQFKTRSALDNHERAHQGHRPYHCEHCPASYASRSALLRHRYKHLGLEFICDTCKRSMKTKEALIIHMNTHKPEKPFACEDCGRRYATRMAARLHRDRAHLRLPPPCACQLCPKRYPRMSVLKTHMQKVHGMDLITKKMFYKSLPMMTSTTIDQAKVVFKSEIEEKPKELNDYEIMLKDIEEASAKEKSDANNDEDNATGNEETEGAIEIELTDDINNVEAFSEVLQYIKNLKGDFDSNIVFIKDGQYISFDRNQLKNIQDIFSDDDDDAKDDKELVRKQVEMLIQQNSLKELKEEDS